VASCSSPTVGSCAANPVSAAVSPQQLRPDAVAPTYTNANDLHRLLQSGLAVGERGPFLSRCRECHLSLFRLRVYTGDVANFMELNYLLHRFK
jgi:hypothetical protein